MKTPRKSFTKIDKYTHIERAAAARVLSSSAMCILSTLEAIIAEGEAEYGAVSMPNSVLSKVTGYTRKTVSIGINKLADYGFIGIAKLGRNNVYILSPDLISMTQGERKTYTSLDGVKILVTDAEAIEFKNEVRELMKSKKDVKFPKDAGRLNSRKVKTGSSYKVESVKNEIVVDKDTGEIL